MPRKLPPYVVRERTRHGRVTFYFRRGKGQRVRLPDIRDPAFEEAYQRARKALPPSQARQERQDTLAWLIGQYQRSSAYAGLAQATRDQRDNIFRQAVKESGAYPFAAITPDDIREARERRKETPHQSRNVLDAYRGLFTWAVEAGHLTSNPTEGVANPKRIAGPGFLAWTMQDVAQFRKRWPRGTPQHLWLTVLLETGARRGDAVRIGWQHVKHRMATVETEKTGVYAFIPISGALARELRLSGAGRRATWICGDRGTALTKESFGNLFRAACREAGLPPKKSAHGVRKLAATLDAEGGLTVEQMKAVYGWTSDAMASHYAKTANRRKLAEEAARARKIPRTVRGTQ